MVRGGPIGKGRQRPDRKDVERTRGVLLLSRNTKGPLLLKLWPAPLLIRRFEDLPELELTVANNFQEVLRDFDRLVLRPGLNNREAGDELLRFGEGTVGHSHLSVQDADPRAVGAWQAPL